MSLARVAQAVQQLVLANGRLAPAAVQACGQPALARFFASGYLDRNEVTERILEKVKSFDKVDSSKVPSCLYTQPASWREWQCHFEFCCANALMCHTTITVFYALPFC